MAAFTNNILIKVYKSLKTFHAKTCCLCHIETFSTFSWYDCIPQPWFSLQLVRMLSCAPTSFQGWWVLSVVRVSRWAGLELGLVQSEALVDCFHQLSVSVEGLACRSPTRCLKGSLAFAEKVNDLKKKKPSVVEWNPLHYSDTDENPKSND